MARLRRIEPMELPETERAPVLGDRPALAWVRPTDLLVDATYQRDLSPSSVRLIRSIVRELDAATRARFRRPAPGLSVVAREA